MDVPSGEQCEEVAEARISYCVRHHDSMLEKGMQFQAETTTPQATAMLTPGVVHCNERVLYPTTDLVEETHEENASETINPSSDELPADECSAEIVTATVLPVAHVENAEMVSMDSSYEFDSPEWWAKHVHYVKATFAILILIVISLSVSLGLAVSPRACPSPSQDTIGVNTIIGVYERNEVERTLGYWSRAEVVYDVKNTFRWRLHNGVSWSMHWEDGALRMGQDCPYGELVVGIETTCHGKDAVQEVYALSFNGGVFRRI